MHKTIGDAAALAGNACDFINVFESKSKPETHTKIGRSGVGKRGEKCLKKYQRNKKVFSWLREKILGIHERLEHVGFKCKVCFGVNFVFKKLLQLKTAEPLGDRSFSQNECLPTKLKR